MGTSILISRTRKLSFLFTFCLVGIFSAQAQKSAISTSRPATAETKNRNITYSIIEAPNKTFGYDIFVEGRLLIHQPSVPGLAGMKGFVRKCDAEKVAALVIKKIESGVMPP